MKYEKTINFGSKDNSETIKTSENENENETSIYCDVMQLRSQIL